MKPWLPSASDEEIATAIAKVLVPWQERWFVGAPALSWKRRQGAALTEASEGSHVLVEASAQDSTGAALHAIGYRAEPANARDSEFLEHLGHAITADLRRCLEEAAGKLDQTAGGDLTWWSLGLNSRGWMIEVGLSRSALCRLRQEAAGRSHDLKIGTLQSAISTEIVAVGCHLGSAQITAGELKTLSRGDVIMFDRRRSDAVPLVVNGVPASIGAVRISAGAEGPAVTLTNPFAFSRNRNLKHVRT